jgi:ribonuclease HI
MSKLFSILVCTIGDGNAVKQLYLFGSDNTDNTAAAGVVAPTQKHQWKLYVDGASRNNPGPSGAGIYLLKDNVVIEKQGYFLGVKTNNEAEYLALILGMFLLRQFVTAADEVFIVSDSQLLIRQLQGKYRVRTETLKPFYAVAHTLITQINPQLLHVLRAENIEADKLANLGIDKKRAMPQEFILLLQKHGLHG